MSTPFGRDRKHSKVHMLIFLTTPLMFRNPNELLERVSLKNYQVVSILTVYSEASNAVVMTTKRKNYHHHHHHNPATRQRTYGEQRSYSSSLSQPWHEKGASGQQHTPAACYPQKKNPQYPLHRGWVGPRAGRVQRMDEKSSASTRN
jgi:hypothetical protein